MLHPRSDPYSQIFPTVTSQRAPPQFYSHPRPEDIGWEQLHWSLKLSKETTKKKKKELLLFKGKKLLRFLATSGSISQGCSDNMGCSRQPFHLKTTNSAAKATETFKGMICVVIPDLPGDTAHTEHQWEQLQLFLAASLRVWRGKCREFCTTVVLKSSTMFIQWIYHQRGAIPDTI